MQKIEEKLEIKNMIYEIRGKQVMLDSDLAKLYGYKNGIKSINLAANRNLKRFPSDFYFQISKCEFETSSSHGVIQKLPYVFTEQGVAMLASVLKTEKANEVSVNIMRAFAEMRKFIKSNSDIFIRLTKVEYKLLENDEKFEKIFDELQGKDVFKEKFFYDGQIYDAYSLLINIVREAKEKLIN